MDHPSPPVPRKPTRASLARALNECRACDLWEGATQAVMGQGADGAEVMLVGEQPGDREDIEGHPFVGPAGGVLDRGLKQAGISRSDVYVTNVVKHFRYKARGKRRIHQKPDRWQTSACLPWLEAMAGGKLDSHPSTNRPLRHARRQDSGRAPIPPSGSRTRAASSSNRSAQLER